MQISVDVRGVRGVQEALNRLPEAAQGRAMAQALQRTAAKGRTEIDRAVRAEFAIGATETRNSIDIGRAGRFERGTLKASITIFGSPSKRGRSANVVRFLERKVSLAEARRRRKAGTLQSLRFQFKKGESGKIIPGAFLGNKGRTVFRRVGSKRTPIEPVQVIGVSQMFSTRRIRDRVLDRIRSELVVEVNSAVRLALSRG